MFGIDFPEFLVIAVVALIVLGPERLPKAARFAGLWVRRARSQWNSVKNELERELAADELKRSLHDTEAALHDIDADVRAADAEARREFDAMRKATTSNAPIAAAPVAAAPDAAAPVAMTPTDHRGDDAREPVVRTDANEPAPVMTRLDRVASVPATTPSDGMSRHPDDLAAHADSEDDVRRT